MGLFGKSKAKPVVPSTVAPVQPALAPTNAQAQVGNQAVAQGIGTASPAPSLLAPTKPSILPKALQPQGKAPTATATPTTPAPGWKSATPSALAQPGPAPQAPGWKSATPSALAQQPAPPVQGGGWKTASPTSAVPTASPTMGTAKTPAPPQLASAPKSGPVVPSAPLAAPTSTVPEAEHEQRVAVSEASSSQAPIAPPAPQAPTQLPQAPTAAPKAKAPVQAAPSMAQLPVTQKAQVLPPPPPVLAPVVAVDPAVKAEQDTIAWLGKEMGVTLGTVNQFVGAAQGALAKIAAKDLKNYHDHGLTDEDLLAVAMYTTNAAYAINAILRGQIKDPAWAAAYSGWGAKAAAALPKMPKGAVNKQGEGKIDPSQADTARINFDTVYRFDGLDRPAFQNLFLSGYKVGASLTEPGFLSTTLIKGSYDLGKTGITRTISNASAAKNISALSAFPAENEALLTPQTKMTVTSIVDRDTGAAVSDPSKKYTAEQLKTSNFEVATRLDEVGPAKDAKAAPEAPSGPVASDVVQQGAAKIGA